MAIIYSLLTAIGVVLCYVIVRLFVANRREERMLADRTRRQVALMRKHFSLSERLSRLFPNTVSLP